MYEVKILPSAHRDLTRIVGYMVNELKNPIAADKFFHSVEKGLELLKTYPSSNPVFSTVKPTKNEIRSQLIGNYLLLYSIGEAEKTVSVIAVVYAKRDIDNILGIED